MSRGGLCRCLLCGASLLDVRNQGGADFLVIRFRVEDALAFARGLDAKLCNAASRQADGREAGIDGRDIERC